MFVSFCFVYFFFPFFVGVGGGGLGGGEHIFYVYMYICILFLGGALKKCFKLRGTGDTHRKKCLDGPPKSDSEAPTRLYGILFP